MSTEAVWRILRKSWWVLAIGATIGGLLGFAFFVAAPKHYQAEAQVLIQPVESDAETLAVQQPLIRELLPTYIAIARADTSLLATSERLGGNPGVNTLRQDLEFVADEDSPVIIVTATGDTGREAAEVANAGAATLLDEVEGGRNGTVEASAVLLVGAEAPRTPSDPDPAVVVPAGIIVGVLVVLLVLLAGEGNRRRPRVLRRIESATGAPMLGILEPVDDELTRAARRTGLPTSAVGIRGRLRRLPYSTIALVHASTEDETHISTLTSNERHSTRGTTTSETWAVPLSDQLAALPEDAVAVLVIGEGCSSSKISAAARFTTGHGVPVVGCILAPLGRQEHTPSLDTQEDSSIPDGEGGHAAPRRWTHLEVDTASAPGGFR